MEDNKALEEKAKANSNIHPVALVAGGVVLGVFLLGFLYHSSLYVSTDDAHIDGKIVAISPKVSAHVDQVLVEDNQAVKAGDPLVTLDSQDFEVKAQMAKANLEAASAEQEQATRDLERYKVLEEKEEISKQQLDKAELRVRTAAAQASAAEAALKQAQLNVSYTKILAPGAGYVTKKSVEVGAFVQTGQPLMALVTLEDVWVVANFKETQLEHVKPGQKVDVKVDTYPGRTFSARVESVMAGTGAAFSLFPPENALGNYVKVVQRVPVKIVLDKEADPEHVLRVGMSVVAKIRVKE